ncbi:MAG: L,D-transpeptidase, partial [Leptospiraceae bacterium]|nr:L,D-transpeptidase [Leptospiraceae bacterium]
PEKLILLYTVYRAILLTDPKKAEKHFFSLLLKEFGVSHSELVIYIQAQNNAAYTVPRKIWKQKSIFQFFKNAPLVKKIISIFSLSLFLFSIQLAGRSLWNHLNLEKSKLDTYKFFLPEDTDFPFSYRGIYTGDKICLQPLLQYNISPDKLENPYVSNGFFAGEYYNLRGRYIVADLDLQDSEGKCKGVSELLPKELLDSGYKPIEIEPSKEDCRGQSLNLCELSDNKTKLIATFITSSGVVQETYRDYYAPIMEIRHRNGDGRNRNYLRDLFFNGKAPGNSGERLLKYNNKIPMPNFLHFVPLKGMLGETQNGIHRYPYPSDRVKLGRPASLGCLRTSDAGSRFIRDWTPLGARLFILHKTVGHPLTDYPKQELSEVIQSSLLY